MTTTVINISKCPSWRADGAVYIGRGSPFGNPYRITRNRSRLDSIADFRIYFSKKIRDEPDFREMVLKLKGKVLACYCKPLPCHGDIIANWLDKRGEEGVEIHSFPPGMLFKPR